MQTRQVQIKRAGKYKRYTVTLTVSDDVYQASININNIIKIGIGVTEKDAMENLLEQIK